MEWSQRYPGTPPMVPAIRAFVAGLLDDSPRRYDAAVIASELATNALRHSRSGCAGGEIDVTVAAAEGWARIAVTDQGPGGWTDPIGPAGETDESGRGLEIVCGLADKMGHDVGELGQTVWAELTWPTETTTAGGASAESPAVVNDGAHRLGSSSRPGCAPRRGESAAGRSGGRPRTPQTPDGPGSPPRPGPSGSNDPEAA